MFDQRLIMAYFAFRVIFKMSSSIKHQSIQNPLLAEALQRLAAEGAAAVPNSVLTVVADRLRAALEGLSSSPLGQVEEELKTFFREALRAAPKKAREAVQGSGDADTAAAFLLGQAAFAHLVAARTLDTRVDQAFLDAAADKRYEKYLRALLDRPKDGITLARLTGEAAETVSRKLGVLRTLGLVVARQEGKAIVNKLSPAANALLVHQGAQPLGEAIQRDSALERTLDAIQAETPESLRRLPVLGDVSKRAA